MAEQVSIWRWVVADDLDALFARAVGASDAEFTALGFEIAVENPAGQESLDDIEAKAEAKFRAMDLPKEVFNTMMAGFRDMMADARADAAADEEEDGDFAPDPDGRVGIALASSHMFFDDPYASLGYDEIERQVQAQFLAYRDAISKAVGHAGQSLADYFGISLERSYEDDVFDALMEAGLAEVEWLWVVGDQVYFLGQWHEDKELPIDLEFGRAPCVVFEAAQARIAGSHEM